jgi:ABC-type uncharacterized transport system permease subunit
MINLIASLTAISLYLVCTLTLLMRLRESPTMLTLGKTTALLPGFLALVAHIYILEQSMVTPIGINIGFYTALSLIAAFITLFTLASALRHPVEMLGILVMPLAALSLFIDMTEFSSHLLPPGSSHSLIFHILTSLIAYSVLALAAMLAIALWVQNNYLHRHQPGGMIRLLPPLITMESLLFETIIIGFIFLSISLISGLVFLENMFAQHLVHKTVLSILAWCVFAILLVGRWLLGWRGRTAIRWTLGGFISLMLAYFGSKFVLEVILGIN